MLEKSVLLCPKCGGETNTDPKWGSVCPNCGPVQKSSTAFLLSMTPLVAGDLKKPEPIVGGDWGDCDR